MALPNLNLYHLGKDVTAFSTTRQGGCSEGRYGEFNINPYCGDNEDAIRRNREGLCRLLGIGEDRLVMPHQVHGDEIAVVDEMMIGLPAKERTESLEGIDALMTDMAGVCIGVSTADCIPVLLYDSVHRAVCAVHAGWRGTVKRIAQKALAKMTAVYGTQPADITAQIGPGIHLDSFEVGDEVYESFAGEGFEMEALSKKMACSDGVGEKWHIDLPECNRLQLTAAGVRADNITVSPICTFMQSDIYFSARRLGINSGRIFTGILLR
ncbi:MAG: peptidoglycan editing factor PgeF [Bacteroidaceae bacterium]|nr:peptidoglycan editing factor PgeF [Bacteroidaceae bacterium]